MKLTKEQKQEIKNRFKGIENVEQLAELLNWIYNAKYLNRNQETNVVIQAKELNYYAFSAQERYINFEIPKKNKNETRPISAPKYKLKTIQKCLNEMFNAIFEPHRNSFGFIPSKSVVDNAQLHVGKNFVYNIDIEGFFPSTEFRRVKTVLGLKPFYLTEAKEPLAFLIANLCCDKIKITKDGKEIEVAGLPQGAPTSPTLTNIVCQRLDKRLTRLAKRYKATYSRYADDITFSAHTDIFDKWFKARLKVIIERQENYKINLAKERLQDWNKRQEVTGVVVNKKTNVNRAYIKDIHFWLNNWEKKNEITTQELFEKFFPNKKSFTRHKGNAPAFQNYLFGKILYLGMVRGKEDAMFKTFMERYASHTDTKETLSKDTTIDNLLTIWEREGIEAAMKLFARQSK